MATSGSYGAYVYRAGQLIEDAALAAGIPSQMLTADLLIRALRSLNLLLASMPNLRIYTWQQQQILIPLYEAQAAISAPVGTFNLLDRNLRKPARLTNGTLASSAGGTIAYADDDDFETKITQVSPDGNVSITFTDDTQLYEVGLLWGSTTDVEFVIERLLPDAATWLQVGGTYSASAVDREWMWIALDGAVPSTAWRVRYTNGATLSLRELYFGGYYNDVPFGPYSRTNYSQMPNRQQKGQPLEMWLDRQADQVRFYIWPVTSQAYRYYHVAAFQQRYIASVSSLRETLDVPQNWYDYVTKALAVRLCETFEEAKKDRLQDLRLQRAEVQMPAVSEDRDGSPITIIPGIRAYT